VAAAIFIAIVIAVVFIVDLLARWWRENEWKRRWRRPPD